MAAKCEQEWDSLKQQFDGLKTLTGLFLLKWVEMLNGTEWRRSARVDQIRRKLAAGGKGGLWLDQDRPLLVSRIKGENLEV